LKHPAKIYHIAESVHWTKGLEQGEYRCPSLESEGFIHFSTEDQVIATANRHYHGMGGLLLVTVSVTRLTARLEYEKAPIGEYFPHLFGPLNVDAVEKVRTFEPNANGEFIAIPV
jgi:uncharacterized protein (DUF952 family)